MKKIAVLTTSILGRKNYVANLMSLRSDNKHLVNYTTELDNAKGFDSEEKAHQFIPTMVNPHDRQFDVEVVEIDPIRKPATQLVEEDIK